MSMHQLYRHFDKGGELLYVGRSIAALCRLLQHGKAPWADEISFVDIDKFGSGEELATAEALAIATENPIYNRVQPLVCSSAGSEQPPLKRQVVGSSPTTPAKFDREGYHRNYMRDYMRKRRAEGKSK